MDKNELMNIAINLSDNNRDTNKGGPFGACVVKDGKIIGKGTNRVLKDNDPTAHAEVTAIREACKNLNTYDLSGCELYTSSYPCPMCLSAIFWSNIKKVYYAATKEDVSNIGFRDENIYIYINQMLNNELDQNIIKFESLNREEAIKVLQKYRDEEKTIY